MSATSEFTIDGRRFELRHLSPEDACLGVEALGRAVGPAVIALFAGEKPSMDQVTAVIFPLVSNASQLSTLLKLFTPVAKFDRGGNGILVELGPFVDEVFGGRFDVLIAFLVHAVRAEFAIFLGGGGALVPLLKQVVGKSASPKAPTA